MQSLFEQSELIAHADTASGVTLGLAVTIGGITAPLLGKGADVYGLAPALVGLACVSVLAIGCALTLPSEETLLSSPQQVR